MQDLLHSGRSTARFVLGRKSTYKSTITGNASLFLLTGTSQTGQQANGLNSLPGGIKGFNDILDHPLACQEVIVFIRSCAVDCTGVDLVKSMHNTKVGSLELSIAWYQAN